MTNLLIVESPNKVQTIQHFLGKDWVVKASVGHITEFDKTPEDPLGFTISKSDVTFRYAPRGDRGAKVISSLKQAARSADKIYLATDPDREGEGISYHLLEQVLKPVGKKSYYRVTYTEITEAAIRAAIGTARQLDMDLVHAQQSRQALDWLMGLNLSRLAQSAYVGKSAGRVQSAATHILCELERTIQNFKPTPYWSLSCKYKEGLSATYLGSDGDGVSSEEEPDTTVDESSDPTEAKQSESKRVLSQAEADRIIGIARSNPHQVIEYSGTQASKSPPPPLTTSSLQQAAGVKYGLNPETVMNLAQELFAGAYSDKKSKSTVPIKLPDGTVHGLITYHRTDSVTLSGEFQERVADWLTKHHPQLLPEKAARHKSKEGAQAAHEAIRPVDVAITPQMMEGKIPDNHLKLYTLIWQRAVASLCAPAQLLKTKVLIRSGTTLWIARGAVLQSPGYTVIWKNLGEDSELPALSKGQKLNLQEASAQQKMTAPPARMSEAQLVAKLEKLGIGRPSTYASIMQTIKEREYVRLEKKGKTQMLIPTPLGMSLDEFLMQVFPAVCDSRFTAQMETSLDAIASGKQDWKRYLIDFDFNFFQPACDRAKSIVQQFVKTSEVNCPVCDHPLIERPFQSKHSSKPYFLVCQQKSTDACRDVAFFWNDQLSRWVKKGEDVSQHYTRSQEACPTCTKPLAQVPYRNAPEGGKPFYLKCVEGCADVVMFWNIQSNVWKLKGAPKERVLGRLSDCVCQVCGKQLEEYGYQKDGQTKAMLRCSGECAFDDKTKSYAVYFKTSRGFFNFELNDGPHKEKTAQLPPPGSTSSKLSAKSSGKSAGKSSSKSSGKSDSKAKGTGKKTPAKSKSKRA